MHLHPAPGKARRQIAASVSDERRESLLMLPVDRDVVTDEQVDPLELVFPPGAPEKFHLESRFLQGLGDIERKDQPRKRFRFPRARLAGSPLRRVDDEPLRVALLQSFVDDHPAMPERDDTPLPEPRSRNDRLIVSLRLPENDGKRLLADARDRPRHPRLRYLPNTRRELRDIFFDGETRPGRRDDAPGDHVHGDCGEQMRKQPGGKRTVHPASSSFSIHIAYPFRGGLSDVLCLDITAPTHERRPRTTVDPEDVANGM
ncbi:MAG: hypothetical protein BWY66_02502 [bacterium ADurb.Bin374]|nr:MAG: hypothetical protein BWY66_02502 [bacterium ADurb.Bin374]